jgi:hypothetical protein
MSKKLGKKEVKSIISQIERAMDGLDYALDEASWQQVEFAAFWQQVEFAYDALLMLLESLNGKEDINKLD